MRKYFFFSVFVFFSVAIGVGVFSGVVVIIGPCGVRIVDVGASMSGSESLPSLIFSIILSAFSSVVMVAVVATGVTTGVAAGVRGTIGNAGESRVASGSPVAMASGESRMTYFSTTGLRLSSILFLSRTENEPGSKILHLMTLALVREA